MGKTSIEWTDASWNPIVGCTEVSPGCANCYAARLAATRLRNTPQYKDLAALSGKYDGDVNGVRVSSRWAGQLRFLPERLEEPLHWRQPRKIFVCDMGDLFHESVPAELIAQVFMVMRDCPQHTFQVLTKRPQRMLDIIGHDSPYSKNPLRNVWVGVSVENQHFADERIPLLLATPAAVRWISAEPLLGPVNLRDIQGKDYLHEAKLAGATIPRALDWIVCGGESGPNARPMHPDWARSLRDQCLAAGVPFFFKQWGEWADPRQSVCAFHSGGIHDYVADGREHSEGCPNAKSFMVKSGKKAAGRLLDGREWNEFPVVAHATD
jgi:protein gp37